MQETWVWFVGQEDPLEGEMATHSRILPGRIRGTEEPGIQQSMGSQRIRHDLAIQSVPSLSHVQLCDPMDCSMPGFPFHHQLLELAQTHVYWVGDAIHLSHALSSPSPPAFNLSPLPPPQPIRIFHESVLPIRWSKYWSFSLRISPSNEYSGLISFRVDWLDLLAV